MSLEEFQNRVAQEAWQRGLSADERGDADEAYVELRLVCDLAPASEVARERFGKLCLTTGRHDEALSAFKEMCRLSPDCADGWALLAFTQAVMGEYEAAMLSYRRSVECPDPDAAHYLNLGTLYFGAEMFAEAEEVYRAALRLWPQHPGAHYRLGLTRERLGNHVGAVASFKRAAQLNEQWFDAYFRLGRACEEIECYGEAFDAYSRAVELAPLSVEARASLVDVCEVLGRRVLAAAHRSVLVLLDSSRVRRPALRAA